MKVTCLFLAFLLLPLSAAEPPATAAVTLLEGPLRMIRGVNVLSGAEGVHLRPGDILETGDKGFAQVEFTGGGIVALGPSTRLYLMRTAKPGGITELVILSGWLKGESGGHSFVYDSPMVSAAATNGTVIVRAADGGCDLFVESGAATISEVNANGAAHSPKAAKAGQFFSCRPDRTLSPAPRPTPAFVDALPRAFRDTLPARAAALAGKPAEPKADHAATFNDVQHWLMMPMAWRRGMASRFESRLRDPGFKKEIEAHQSQLPDWQPILNPEKSSPKTEPASQPERQSPQPRS